MNANELEVFREDKPFAAVRGVQERGARSKRSAANKPSILVVDDQDIIADSLLDILNGAGFRAVVAYDGASALRLAELAQPDYLLTDVVMPGMNGVELAIAIRNKYPATKIVLFSGQVGISDILLQGKHQGYEFELIAKPIHPDKLIDRLKGIQGR
ncbi:MAG TPA: response regulator [Acidobacteriaceae bacterium]|jgi:CheY-like chemotaxis protein|nr:response regulator [Acidobacteriaceae bacterium]